MLCTILGRPVCHRASSSCSHLTSGTRAQSRCLQMKPVPPTHRNLWFGAPLLSPRPELEQSVSKTCPFTSSSDTNVPWECHPFRILQGDTWAWYNSQLGPEWQSPVHTSRVSSKLSTSVQPMEASWKVPDERMACSDCIRRKLGLCILECVPEINLWSPRS